MFFDQSPAVARIQELAPRFKSVYAELLKIKARVDPRIFQELDAAHAQVQDAMKGVLATQSEDVLLDDLPKYISAYDTALRSFKPKCSFAKELAESTSKQLDQLKDSVQQVTDACNVVLQPLPEQDRRILCALLTYYTLEYK